MQDENSNDFIDLSKIDLLEYFLQEQDHWSRIPDHETKIRNILAYYKEYEADIIAHNTKSPLVYLNSYPFDWFKIFTPIEQHAWSIIRSIGRIVLYPQYPILNYRTDFANPVKKIVLECDGRDFHNEQKDRARDTNLLSNGWKTFRVTGSELHRTFQPEFDEYENEYPYDDLRHYFMNTAEGVIEAIRDIYFDPIKDIDDLDDKSYRNLVVRRGLQEETLRAHRLVEFEIPEFIFIR